MPCYNRQDYIGESIESVLTQSFSDFELVIIDNCSTDNTVEIVRQYAEKDKRIKLYVNERNIGICSSMNRCILNSCGEYIKFLFSDDLLAPKCIETFVDVMDKNPGVSLVTSFTRAVGQNNTVRDEKFFPQTGLFESRKAQKSLFFDGNWPGSPSNTMLRRRDLHIGLFNHMWKYWLGDLDMWMRLLGAGDAYIVPEILNFPRIHDNSESAIHGVDFRLITERITLADTAFRFPHVYGEYTGKEKRNIQNHLLERLVREGYGKKGLRAKISMLKIGLFNNRRNRFVFLLLLLKNLGRLFRKSRWSD